MVQSLDIPDFENILAREATLGSEKISISQQQVFVTRLMRPRADGCVSLFVSALLALYLVVLSSVAPAVTDMDEMPKQHSFTSTLLTPSSPPPPSPRKLFLSPFLGLARTLFQFLQEMPLRRFHMKRNHRIMNKIRNTSQWCLLHKKNGCIGDSFKIMYLF